MGTINQIIEETDLQHEDKSATISMNVNFQLPSNVGIGLERECGTWKIVSNNETLQLWKQQI